jgi:regulator of sigma E protease
MELIQHILSLLLTLVILVTVHEFGHFWVARRCGVKVHRFSIGFGTPLLSWRDRHGTEFAVAGIPLGGYVKMLDEREGPVTPDQLAQAFNRKTPGQRIAITAAGPLANFLFAILVYATLFSSGFSVLVPKLAPPEAGSLAEQAGLYEGAEIVAVDGREVRSWPEIALALVNRLGEDGEILVSVRASADAGVTTHALPVRDWLRDRDQGELLSSLGLKSWRPVVPARVGALVEAGVAELGGLQAGDQVLAINGEPVSDWYDFARRVAASAGQDLELTILRTQAAGQEQILTYVLQPRAERLDDGTEVGRLGIYPQALRYPPEMIRELSYGPVDALINALDQTWVDCETNLVAIGKLLTGRISLENLSGPITIAQVASESIGSGLEDFIRFLAFFSVSLGILNLLPIPVLDGGHIVFHALEALRGRPVSEKWQLIGLKIGVSLILLLMTVAFYNDIMRL